MDWFRLVSHRSLRLRERIDPRRFVDHLHVDRACRPDLVRLWMGNPAPRNRILVDLSLPSARSPPIPQESAASSRDLAFSLARFSDLDRSRPNYAAVRRMLA